MAIGMAVSAISKAVNEAKRTRSKRNKPTAKVATPKPVKGVASVGSTGGSPKPATPTATNDQYKYDLQAWKQSKKALRGS
jgi:hypothetical protein